MKKLLFLFTILLLSSCGSLDFQVRTLNTIGMYDGIYYNSPRPINSNFIFFQPTSLNNFWWNYSLTQPYNWYGYNGVGLTYNWRYNRWSSNQWFLQPYSTPYRFRYQRPLNIVRNRGRRTNTRISVPRTPSPTNTRAIRSINTRSTQSGTVGNTLRIRKPQPVRRIQRPTRTSIRRTPPRQIRRTQSTRRVSTSVIKNKRNQ